jgi:hypothetical protein
MRWLTRSRPARWQPPSRLPMWMRRACQGGWPAGAMAVRRAALAMGRAAEPPDSRGEPCCRALACQAALLIALLHPWWWLHATTKQLAAAVVWSDVWLRWC